jgi:hypothetical protein
MELTTGQRRALFGLIVVVLAVLGGYMFVPGSHAARRSGSPAAHSPGPPAGSSAVPAGSPVPAAAATPSAPDIYQWLPFTQSDLASAAAVVTRFAGAYGTWSYRQNAASYVASLRNLITPELSQFLAQGYSVPGVASQRASNKQVSVGSAVINSLRAFGASSITFVVTIGEDITGTNGRSQVTTQYAVTVVSVGGDWQVNDIELASAGNS